ncbi:hypothetical protein ACWIG5_08165 [Streptomyces lydicus]
MSAHQPSTTPDGRGGTPVAAAAREAPSMNELLAAGAAASAVSTPPDAVEEARRDKPAEPSGAPEAEDEDQDGRRAASTPGRDAA